MKEMVLTVFAIFGFVWSLFFCLFILCCIEERLEDFIDHKKYEYKYKHRFDKPPLAQCYCKDCIKRCENGSCGFGNVNHHVNNWFCADARPRKTDPDKEE